MKIFNRIVVLSSFLAISSTQWAPPALAIGWIFSCGDESDEDDTRPYTQTDSYKELDPNDPKDVEEVAYETVSFYDFLNQSENDSN